MEVSPAELQDLMQRPGPRAFQLIDTREAGDFLLSRLDWAELIPLTRLETEAPKRLKDKTEPIVLYCRDGATSQRACEYLESQGYEFVFHLTGGLEAWKRQIDPAFPLEADELISRGQSSESPPATATSVARPVTRPPVLSPPAPMQTAPRKGSNGAFSHRDVSPEELRELMDRPGPRDFRLIDVREEDEFQICRLDWAELIPLAQLSEQAPRRLVDKDRPLVVYCHHGMRSQHACDWLRRAGYENVYNLTGGIDAWADRVDPTMRRY